MLIFYCLDSNSHIDSDIELSDHGSSESEESFAIDRNDSISLQQIEFETNDDGDEDQINLKSARRSDVLSPSNESNRGAGDSPRRSQSNKKNVLAIGAMFVFIGSIGTAVIWKNQEGDIIVVCKLVISLKRSVKVQELK